MFFPSIFRSCDPISDLIRDPARDPIGDLVDDADCPTPCFDTLTNLGLDNSRRYGQPHSSSFNNFATLALP